MTERPSPRSIFIPSGPSVRLYATNIWRGKIRLGHHFAIVLRKPCALGDNGECDVALRSHRGPGRRIGAAAPASETGEGQRPGGWFCPPPASCSLSGKRPPEPKARQYPVFDWAQFLLLAVSVGCLPHRFTH